MLLLTAWMCCSLLLRAQFMDSLHDVFINRYSIDARLESRYSFINHQASTVNGVRLGVAFKRKLRLGGGVSWLKTDLPEAFYTINEFGLEERHIKRPKFIYLCYYIDFVFYKTKRWQLSVPIQAGTGYCWNQIRRDYYTGNKDPKYFLFLYEPGITAQFKIFRWIGLGTDVAYRFAYSHSKQTGINLNSPTYSFKLLLWFDQLFYELFPSHELSKKYGPAFW